MHMVRCCSCLYRKDHFDYKPMRCIWSDAVLVCTEKITNRCGQNLRLGGVKFVHWLAYPIRRGYFPLMLFPTWVDTRRDVTFWPPERSSIVRRFKNRKSVCKNGTSKIKLAHSIDTHPLTRLSSQSFASIEPSCPVALPSARGCRRESRCSCDRAVHGGFQAPELHARNRRGAVARWTAPTDQRCQPSADHPSTATNENGRPPRPNETEIRSEWWL